MFRAHDLQVVFARNARSECVRVSESESREGTYRVSGWIRLLEALRGLEPRNCPAWGTKSSHVRRDVPETSECLTGMGQTWDMFPPDWALVNSPMSAFYVAATRHSECPHSECRVITLANAHSLTGKMNLSLWQNEIQNSIIWACRVSRKGTGRNPEGKPEGQCTRKEAGRPTKRKPEDKPEGEYNECSGDMIKTNTQMSKARACLGGIEPRLPPNVFRTCLWKTC